MLGELCAKQGALNKYYFAFLYVGVFVWPSLTHSWGATLLGGGWGAWSVGKKKINGSVLSFLTTVSPGAPHAPKPREVPDPNRETSLSCTEKLHLA